MKSKTHAHNGNGYASEGGSSSSPSPPRSPPRQSTNISHCRRRLRPKAFSHTTHRLESLAAGIIARRNLRYFFLLPLLYISGLLMCVGPFSALFGQAPLPGSVYRSHEIFQKLWPDIQSDNSSAVEVRFTGFFYLLSILSWFSPFLWSVFWKEMERIHLVTVQFTNP